MNQIEVQITLISLKIANTKGDMATANQKIMEKLLKLNGAVAINKRNIHADVLQTHSPALNFIFGNGWGLPKGYTLLAYGPPRGGKSMLARSMIGRLHQSDPTAVAIVFDTEQRWEAQLNDAETQVKPYGIDVDRLIVYATNHPSEIFDRIEKELAAAIQAGLNIQLVVIDSITEIQGVRGTDQETIMTQQRGDHASTIQNGLKQILNTIRTNKIGLVLTTQIRDEQDPTELMKRKTKRPAAAWALKHFCEYWLLMEPIDSQAGRKDLMGNELVDSSMTVFKKDGETSGHKVRARITSSSMGPKNRVAEFTIDYKKGFINQYEEIFELGTGSGAIEKPTSMSYAVDGRKWTGRDNFLEALKTEPELAESVLVEVKKRDLAGTFKTASELEPSDDDSEESPD